MPEHQNTETPSARRDQAARLEARTWLDAGAPSGELPPQVFRAFVDAINDSIVWFNTDRTIIYANASFLRDFGLTWEEAIGQPITDLVDGRERDEMLGRLERAFALTPEQPTRVEEFRATGGQWLSSVFTAYFTSDGELVTISDHARDQTERQEARQALETTNQRLAESNRDLQDFAYIASHDLQEPLRKISAFGDRLATKYADSLDDRGLDYLARIRSASGRMQTLIDDVLSFSRVATHGQAMEMTDTGEVITGVIEDLEIAIAESDASVDVGDMPTLSIDPSQVRQLFQNLIGNSIKFRKPDVAPAVTIRAAERAVDLPGRGCRDGWEITVQDNGIGFEDKYVDRIFTVFQRLHNRTEYEGSGVGLAVCRRIVERHGGLLTANGSGGDGAVFTIWLPSEHVDDAV